MACSISNLDEVPHVVPVPPEEARCARVILQHEGDGAGGSPLFGSLVAVVNHFTFAKENNVSFQRFEYNLLK